jgi:hypothetical protein
MTPRKSAFAVEVPLSQSSHDSHLYVVVKVLILDKAPIKATTSSDQYQAAFQLREGGAHLGRSTAKSSLLSSRMKGLVGHSARTG